MILRELWFRLPEPVFSPLLLERLVRKVRHVQSAHGGLFRLLAERRGRGKASIHSIGVASLQAFLCCC